MITDLTKKQLKQLFKAIVNEHLHQDINFDFRWEILEMLQKSKVEC